MQCRRSPRVLALVSVALGAILLPCVAAAPAQAVILDGCSALNGTDLEGVTSSTAIGPYRWYAGDRLAIELTAGYGSPPATKAFVTIDQAYATPVDVGYDDDFEPGAGDYAVVIEPYAGGTPGGNVDVTFTCTSAPGPTPTSTSPAAGPVLALQQLPMPASGDCADADSENALWAQGNATPWTRQWGEWSAPVEFRGLVCGRLVRVDGTT